MTPEAAGGKAVWESTPEKREASLRERKAQMILAARRCVFFLCILLFRFVIYLNVCMRVLMSFFLSRRILEQEK